MPQRIADMATATKARKAKSEEPALTLTQAVENRLRESLETYRGFVDRAVAGDQLYAGELERVEATLTDELAKLDEAQPAAEAEAKQLAAEIPQIERRLNEARGRLNELQKVRPATQIGLAQRLQEFKVNHPHLFHTVGKAIEIRMEARRKLAAQQRPAELPKEGWLP